MATHRLGDNVEVRENADGIAEIEHTPSGNTAQVGPDGLSAPAIHTEVLSHDNIENVISHGAVGDGVTDDSAALQSAADAATPHGVVYIPSQAILYLGSQVDIDLGLTDTEVTDEDPDEMTRFGFISDGAVRPASGLADAIHIHHGVVPQINLRVDGGGGDPDTDTALYLSDMISGKTDLRANNYGGTACRVDNGSTNAGQLSFGRIETIRCGRSLLLENIDGFGELTDIWEYNSVKNLTIRNANDISINQYENFVDDSRTTQGVVFDNCSSCWIDKMAVGGSASLSLIKFVDSDYIWLCKSFALSEMGASTTGIEIDGLSNSVINSHMRHGSRGLDVSDANYSSTTIRGYVQVYDMDNEGVRISSNVGGPYYLYGQIVGCGNSETPAMDVQSSKGGLDFRLVDFMFSNGDANYNLQTAANTVSLWGSRLDPSTINGPVELMNNYSTESFNAEEPQGEYPVGCIIDFTDTGDDSGTGHYVKNLDGTYTQIA